MHAIVRDHLEKMLEGRLPKALRDELEGHLTSCTECRTAYDEALETSRLLRLLVAEDAPEPAPGFSIKVMQNIAEARAARRWFGFPALRELAVAAAMFVVLLGGYYLTVQATGATNSAEVLLDMPVEREAPALLATHQHSDLAEMCRQCWQHKQDSQQLADDHSRRERVFASLAEMGD